VDRCLGATILIGSPQRFAIDGDDLSIKPGQPRDPRDKAPLELLGVEDGKNIAELVVRRRFILERPQTFSSKAPVPHHFEL
jgi:hypothetical protein